MKREETLKHKLVERLPNKKSSGLDNIQIPWSKDYTTPSEFH